MNKKNCLEKFNKNFEKVNFNVPRIVIGATSSGTGKTTITCAILMAFKKRGYNVSSFKCGPDYIDPMFHRKALGISSTNLDLFFTDRQTTLWIMKEACEDITKNQSNEKKSVAVMEGVMGYYDGVAGTTIQASTFDLADTTKSPAILIVDGKGKSLSLVAEIKGFLEFKNNSHIKGIIINRVSAMMFTLLKDTIEKSLGIKVLGYFPVMDDGVIESRHLGLVTADEVKEVDSILEKLGNQAEISLDMDEIIRISMSATDLTFNKSEKVEKFQSLMKNIEKDLNGEKLRIGVAKDKAFCFYYNENLKILENLGCQLVEFSPLNDNCLPRNLSGIMLGGGYPELYGKELANNISFKESLRKALKSGMPCLAECGGFMYLHEAIEDRNGNLYEMIGALEGKSYPLEKMGRFGYINLEFNGDCFLGKKGSHVKAHEFHYWESENPGNFMSAKKPLRKRNWQCGIIENNIFAGFPHLYFWSNPEIPIRLVGKCKSFFDKNR